MLNVFSRLNDGQKGAGDNLYLSICISPSPVDNLSSGKLPIGTHVFSRAFRTLYGLTGIPSACKENQRDQSQEPGKKIKNKIKKRDKISLKGPKKD